MSASSRMSAGPYRVSNGRPLLRARRSTTAPVSACLATSRVSCAAENEVILAMYRRIQPRSALPRRW